MKIIAINGSPRKNWNTATVLQKALDGAASAAKDVSTELVHLYSEKFDPCLSCFECKKLGGKSYGRCALQDELRPVLERIAEADGIILGTPIYFGNLTAKMQAFIERLCFPFLVYDATATSLAPKKLATAFIYTMNVDYALMKQFQYDIVLEKSASALSRVFSEPEQLYVFDTYQFEDYTKYKCERFNEEDKSKQRREQFPKDCENAFALGRAMAGRIVAGS